MDKNRQTDYYPIYDYLRMNLALMVIAIHVGLFPNVLFPWLRSAVPLFFILSSYHLFSRLQGAQPEEKRSILRRFVIRNLRFYLFWFIALAPITFYSHQFFANGVVSGLLALVQATLFSSTFFSSWFIAALIIGTLIVYYASKFMHWKVLLSVAVLIYAAVCFRSCYWKLVPEDSFLASFANVYEQIFTEPYKSFPVAILWIVIGKLFAEKKIQLSKKQSWFTLALGIVLLFGEWKLVEQISGEIRNDCYCMLLPFCVGVFSIIRLNENRTFTHDTRALRKASAITYASHGSIVTLISAITNKLFHVNAYSHSLCLFIITTLLSLLLSAILILLSRHKVFALLKYSY